MYCYKCGKELQNGTRLCPYCGYDLQNKQSATKKWRDKAKKPREKRSKGKIIFVTVMILLAVIVIGGAVGVFTSPVYKLYRSLEKEDYASASVLYTESVQDNFLWKWIADRVLSNAVSNEVEAYGANEIDYEEALAYLDAVSQMQALSVADEAAAEVENLMELYESKQTYELAESYYELGDYEAALSAYQEVDELDAENYADAQSKIISATESYRIQVVEKIGTPSTVEEYQVAISILKSALIVIPDDDELQSLLDAYTVDVSEMIKATALTEATSAVAEEDYSNAIDILETALEDIENDIDLSNLLASVQSQYITYIASAVDEFIANNDYESALTLLNEALAVIPDSTELNDLLTSTEAHKPKFLLDVCPPYQTAGYYTEESYLMTGITYVNGFHLNDNYGGIAYFNLNQEYTTLNFDVGHIDGKSMETGCYYFYLDGNLVYTLTLDPEMMVEHVEIPLNNATQLVIEGGYWCHCFALVNVMISG